MKADKNLLVTVSNRNNRGKWQVFATNFADGFVFGVRNFSTKKQADVAAELLADRLSCGIEAV
jgi:hypothetical protein